MVDNLIWGCRSLFKRVSAHSRASILLFTVVSILFPALLGCRPSNTEIVVIKGSDTEVNLVQEMAESYMDREPLVSLTITGGGSGYGIASLINEKTDIANSSRGLSAKEKDLIGAAGLEIYTVIFAQDALAVIVNPATKVSEMDLETIGRIYRGEIKNWKELNGGDVPVSLYGRQSNSGTFVYFRETVVKGEYSADVKQMNGTAQIVEAIKQDPGGIGYIGIGYLINEAGDSLKSATAVALKDKNGAVISPTDKASIIDGRYPLVRPLFQFINGKPQGKALEFLRFELSEEGQNLVTKSGYFAIGNSQRKLNSEQNIGLSE